MVLCRWQPLYWEDVWIHLGVGNYILAHHLIPRADIFSWTVHGARWINTEWLYEVILATLVRGLGLFGVSLLKNVLVWIAIFFVDQRLRLWGASVLERLFFNGVVFLGGWPFWVERADLSSLALFSGLFWWIDRAARRPDGGIREWLPWAVLFMFWANLHGLFIFGLGVLFLYGFSVYVTGQPAGRTVYGGIGLCLGATLLNPNGWDLPLSFFRFAKSSVSNIYEWMPPAGLGFTFFYLSLALAVLSFAGRWRRGRSVFFSACVVGAFGYFACRHQRFIHFFMVGAFPYAGYNWLHSPARARWGERLATYEKVALAGASLFFFWTSLASAHALRGGVDIQSSGYIRRACDFIEQKKIKGPFYNDYKFGAYWIYRFRGDPPVFQDGRHEVVEGYAPLIEAGLEARGTPDTWNRFLNQWGVEAALVRPPVLRTDGKPILERYFPRTTWALVYQDDQCLLFLRRHSRNNAVIRDARFI